MTEWIIIGLLILGFWRTLSYLRVIAIGLERDFQLLDKRLDRLARISHRYDSSGVAGVEGI